MIRSRATLMALLMFVLTGCAPESRYRVLSFFFDGVPEPVSQITSSPAASKAVKTLPMKVDTSRSHGPYAAKLCEGCHERGEGNKLRLPVEELCVTCHIQDTNKKSVHPPVLAGECRACHNPHDSVYPHLLSADPAALCFLCHDKALLAAKNVHKAAEDVHCTECHYPHASDNEHLLKGAF